MKRWTSLMLVLAFLLIQASCKEESKKSKTQSKNLSKQLASLNNVPAFSADSAYSYIQKQVDFGPRNPGSKGWKACGDWLEKKLKSFGAKVKVQISEVSLHDGTKVPMKNYIASFNPEIQRRIFVCAHWDTRPWAENEPDPNKKEEPILGANDGASGVAVGLELGRILSKWELDFGFDIIFFDVEDAGHPKVQDSYCLGSQYWAANPHSPGYQATYGILLDMVGAEDAVFKKEAYSLRYVPQTLDQIWEIAALMGHGNLFLDEKIGPIIDDHTYINIGSSSPCLDIIHHNGENFGEFWHTHDDDMDIISKRTLQAVGDVVLNNILLDMSQKAKQSAGPS